MERKILSALVHDRTTYDQINSVVTEADFSPPGWIIYQKIQSFYETDTGAKAVDKELVCSELETQYPKHGGALKSLLQGLQEVSVPNVVAGFLKLKEQNAAIKLGHALIGGADVEQELEQYLTVRSAVSTTEDDGVYIGTPVAQVTEAVSPENMLRVYPRSLNDVLGGGLPNGSHTLIYALPEVGKSLIGLNLGCMWAKDGHRGIYVGNEDPHNMMLMRVIGRLAGMTKDEIMQDTDQAQERAMANGYENMVFASLSPGTMGQIKSLVKKYKPRWLIVDQLHNLHTKEEGKIEKLESLAKQVRTLAKEKNIVAVSITQAADSARNRLVLDSGDVYFSNIGIPSQMDVMIGVGMNDDFERSNRRMLTLTKNKVSGRHDSIPVFVDPTRSKVTSI